MPVSQTKIIQIMYSAKITLKYLDTNYRALRNSITKKLCCAKIKRSFPAQKMPQQKVYVDIASRVQIYYIQKIKNLARCLITVHKKMIQGTLPNSDAPKYTKTQ